MKRVIYIVSFFIWIMILLLVLSFINIKFSSPIDNKISDILIKDYFDSQSGYYQLIQDDVKRINPNANSYTELTPKQMQQLILLDYNYIGHNMNNPCQFYSYLWKSYFIQNGYKTQYTFVDNHVFVIVQRNSNEYYLADQYVLKQVTYN